MSSLLIGSARIAIVPDISDFATDLRAKLDAELKSLGEPTVQIGVTLNDSSLAAVRAALAAQPPVTVGVTTKLDTSSLAATEAELKGLSDALNDTSVGGIAGALMKDAAVMAALDKSSQYLNDTFGLMTEQRIPQFISDSKTLAAMNESVSESFGTWQSSANGAVLSADELAAANERLADAFPEVYAGEKIAAEMAEDDASALDLRTQATLASIDATLALARADQVLAEAAAAGGGGAAGGGSGSGGSGGAGGLWGAFMGYSLTSGGGWRVAIAGISAWHLALDAAVETLISVGLAAAAAAAGIAAMYSAFSDIHDHEVAVYTVNAALGFQIPDLTQKFNALQTALAPQAWELYGAAMTVITGKTGIFASVAREVVTDFDDWAAEIDLWMKGQGTFGKFLQDGVSYLSQFAHLFGDLGIAIGNLLRDDPGIARFLLDILTGAAKVLDVFTSLPAPIVETTLALHGLYIWGSVIGGIAIKIAQAWVSMGKAFISAVTNPGVWLVAVAAGLAYVAYEATQADSATKAFISNINSGLTNASASTAIIQTTQDLGKLQTQLNGLSWQSTENNMDLFHQVTLNLGYSVDKLGEGIKNLATPGGAMAGLKDIGSALGVIFLGNTSAFGQQVQNDIHAYDAEINKLLGDQKNLFAETGTLMKQGYSYNQALGLMDLAGVRASDSFELMRQKVDNLITAYQDMSVRGGILENSVNAVNFATDLQDSKVTDLTSAWSQFFSLVSGGESGFASFMQALGGSLTTSTSSSSGTSTTTYQGLAQALQTAQGNMTGLGAASISAQSQFISAAQAAQTELNNLTELASAAGLGSKGTQDLTQASKDMVASMLPAAKTSTALTAVLYSLAQQGGYQGADSFEALSKWADNTASPLTNLQGITDKLTVAAGSLTTDIQNLSTALGQTLTQAISSAIFYADGGQKAFNQYATALETSSINSGTTRSAAIKLASELIEVTGNTGNAHKEFDTMTTAMGYTKQQADKLWDSIEKVAKAEASLRNKTVDITGQVSLTGSPAAIALAESGRGVSIGGGVALRGFAGGTSSAPSGPILVGENGPELMIASGGEQVIPLNDLGGLASALGGGNGVNAQALGGAAGHMVVNNTFSGYGSQQLVSAVRVAINAASKAQSRQLRVNRRS